MGALQYRLLLGCAVLVAALALSSVSSTNADEHRVIVGMATTSVDVTTWWHGENALDLRNRVGPTVTNVYHQSHFQSGNGGWLRAVARDYAISVTCHGRYVDLYDPGNNYLGTLNYVHVVSSLPENYTWIIPASGWDIEYIGTVIEQEDTSNCPWTGAHLHQGGVGTNVAKDAGLQSYVASQGQPNIIDPTGDYTNRWLHKVTLIDSDGDGCSDQEELGSNPALGGQRDPHNPYDFASVPPSGLGPPLWVGIEDKAVNVFDVASVIKFVGAAAGGGPSGKGFYYDNDLNNNGRPDGDEFEAQNGSANGAINVFDVQAVIAQVGDSCAAPP
jgi:hypothetical protein